MNSSSATQNVLADREPEPSAQSATLWALAWSDEPESVAEPVPYTGGDDAPQQSRETRSQLPTLLFGIAAGAVAIAVGGLALSVSDTETQPAPAVTTEAVQLAVPPSQDADGANRGGSPRSSLPVNGQSRVADTVPRVANAPQRVANSSKPAIAAAPASTQQASIPQASIPQNVETQPAPAEPAPAQPAPAQVTTPVALPPPAAPPVITPPIVSITPPIVSIPEVTPMPLPHPVVPPVFHVPSVTVAPNPGIVLPPALKEPIVTVAPNPAITLPTDVTLTPFAPKLP